MRSRMKGTNENENTKKYSRRRNESSRKNNKSDIESSSHNKVEKSERRSKSNKYTGTNNDNTNKKCFSLTNILGVIATVSVCVVAGVFGFEVSLPLTSSTDYFNAVRSLPEIGKLNLVTGRAKYLYEAIIEKEDIESEDNFVRSLEQQIYLGDEVLPWENPLINRLKEHVLNGIGSSEESYNALQEAERWLSGKIYTWLNNGDLDFEKLARTKIDEIKTKGLGQESLDKDISTILRSRKALDDSITKLEDLRKKQILIEAKFKQAIEINTSQLDYKYEDKTIDLIIPEEISSLLT